MRLDEIARRLGGELFGPGDIDISGPAKIEQAGAKEITFLANKKYRHFLQTTQAAAVILDEKTEGLQLPYILVRDAYIGFLRLLHIFQPQRYEFPQGVSDRAYVDPTASVHSTAKIAPLAYIGPQAAIGKNTVIYPGVVLLEKVKVGENCILYPHVSIREDCEIGDRVILHNGCVIGSDGFGFAPQDEVYLKIPQIGKVIIEDDVEIGANTAIDRSTVGATIVGRGSKLDNLVQVAHNVQIGRNTVMASQSGIAGSTEVEEHVTIGGQAGITGHIKIRKNAVIAAQSGITKEVPENSVYWGTPAMAIRERKRVDVSLRHLPETQKRVQILEKEIEKLKEKLKQLDAESK